MTITVLNNLPLAVGAAAVYPFKKGWIEVGARTAKYPDENGNRDFNLFRIYGPADKPSAQRIWVPRRMAPSIPKDLRTPGKDVDFKSNFKPRNPEQARVIAEAVKLLKAGENFVTEAPTGFGKTWCGTDIIAQVGKKTMVVVTKEDLRDQWLAAFTEILGLKREAGGVGLLQGDICEVTDRKIVIAMVQSLSKEDKYPPYLFAEFGFVIWDEVHRVGADYFSNSCFRLPALLRMGLSATPDRKDGREEVIAAHIGPVMVRSKQAPMKFRVIRQESPWYCPTRPKKDKEGRQVFDKDTQEPVRIPIEHSAGKCGHIIRMLVHHHGRNKVITNFVVGAFKSGRKVLIQSETKDHLEILASLVTYSGVPTPQVSFYVGGLTKGQREKAATARVIFATYAQMAEGTDIPDLDTLVMATPKSDVRQIVGRVIRFLPDKKEPLVFDLRDDTSPVFVAYAKARDSFYASAGAKVEVAKVAPPQIDKQGKSVTISSFKKD